MPNPKTEIKNTRKHSRVRVRKASSRRRTAATPRRSPGAAAASVRNVVLPTLLSISFLICLGALGVLGYQTVTASDFFSVTKVDVRGVSRASVADIRRIVEMQTERTGVWNADLPGIKEKVERVAWVKSASVSRVLPTGISVQVVERVPQALVKTNAGNLLVDAEGSVIAPSKDKEADFPFVMSGWNETKSEAAGKENVERVKMYQKMLVEWKEFNLSARVQSVDLTDTREPRAFIEDSGTVVSIALGRDKFGEYLKRGINAIVGKGDMFEAVNLVGQNMILAPRKGEKK
jgi:cell division septal protein FtsQ